VATGIAYNVHLPLWSEDRATLAFPTREAPVPPFSVERASWQLTLRTGTLTLRYDHDSGPFGAGNLSSAFELNGKKLTWAPACIPCGRSSVRTAHALQWGTGRPAKPAGHPVHAGWLRRRRCPGRRPAVARRLSSVRRQPVGGVQPRGRLGSAPA